MIAAVATDTASAEGRDLVTLIVGGFTPTVTFSHNALGQRVVKVDTVTESAVHFVYDQAGRVIAEIDAATEDTLREYIYVNGQQVAIVDDTQTQDEALYFVHNDHLGTPQRITDASQAIVWAADYEPFGRATVTLNTIENRIRYPGQYEDQETGLHYNYFRDYDPDTGRYVESDPIGLAGGINTYSYAANNTLIYIDHYGLFKVCRRPLSFVNGRMSSGRTGTNLGIFHAK